MVTLVYREITRSKDMTTADDTLRLIGISCPSDCLHQSNLPTWLRVWMMFYITSGMNGGLHYLVYGVLVYDMNGVMRLTYLSASLRGSWRCSCGATKKDLWTTICEEQHSVFTIRWMSCITVVVDVFKQLLKTVNYLQTSTFLTVVQHQHFHLLYYNWMSTVSSLLSLRLLVVKLFLISTREAGVCMTYDRRLVQAQVCLWGGRGCRDYSWGNDGGS